MDEEDEHFLSASHRKCILLSGTECHIINYLLTELARAVPENIGPRSFLYGPSARPRANIPQYGPRARLVRGYYFYIVIGFEKPFFLGGWEPNKVCMYVYVCVCVCMYVCLLLYILL